MKRFRVRLWEFVRRLHFYFDDYRSVAYNKRQEFIDKKVSDVICDRNPYRIWGEEFPADILTEWELRFVLSSCHLDTQAVQRWFDEKKRMLGSR